MKIYGMNKKKKELTDEQKVRRMKIILIVIAVMLAVIIFAPVKKKDKTDGTVNKEQIMDDNLDSLIVTLGYERPFEIIFKGPIEMTEKKKDCTDYEKLDVINSKIEYIEQAKNLSGTEKEKLEESLISEKEKLVKAIEEFEKNGGIETCASRRITFTKDDRTYTFFQRLFDNRMDYGYFIELTEQQKEAQMESIKNMSN